MANPIDPAILIIANAQYELEKKLGQNPGMNIALRQLARIKNALESLGLIIQDPQGEPYNETRTDLEASIEGQATEDLKVVSVIKPIIYLKQDQKLSLIQKGVVIAGQIVGQK